MSKTYWMLVVDQENLDITRLNGFSVQGVDSRNRRKAVRMTPEDRIIYYVSDQRGFAATATVTSEHFEDHSHIWKDFRPEEDFPNRVNISADVVLEPQDYVDARELAPTLEYLKKWPAELWELAFFGMLHIMPQRDFNLLEEEIKKADLAAALRREAEASKPSPSAAPAAAAASRRRKKKAQVVRRRRRTRAKSGSR